MPGTIFLVKHIIFTYFTDFIFKNKDIIKDDIRKYQIYLQKKDCKAEKPNVKDLSVIR